MKKYFIAAIATLIIPGVPARTLHYGDASVELTEEQKTFPALHVKFDKDETAYGAMYASDIIDARTNTIRITYNDQEYWVGAWCAWRQYLPVGERECVDIPADAMNRFLTLDEATKYIIPTDIQQWELISAYSGRASCEICDDENRNLDECVGKTGTLQAGTYLFREYYTDAAGNNPAPKSQIAIFDHAVGYRQQHSACIFENLIDTEHEIYQSYTMQTPKYNITQEDANVTNMPTSGARTIYLYRLK